MRVSVPCRGLTCFYMYQKILMVQNTIVSVPCRGLTCFYPSIPSIAPIFIVSVPCRGLTCFYKWRYKMKLIIIISVPCRGLTCFYHNNRSRAVMFKFPSPVGVLHVSMMPPFLFRRLLKCFRPLSGSYMFLSIQKFSFLNAS